MRGEFRDAACSMIEKVGLGHRLKHARANSPAARCSGPRSPAPWSASPKCCSPTNRPATSTSRPAGKSWPCLTRLNADENLTIVMVTHDDAIARRAQRIVRLREGRLQALEEAA